MAAMDSSLLRYARQVIYPGIDTVSYTPCPSERAATPVFAYLGRLKRYKGVHHVIQQRTVAATHVEHPGHTLEIQEPDGYLGMFQPARP